MSYEKNTWETGDLITADKLNNIENGIGGPSMILYKIDEMTGGATFGGMTFEDAYAHVTSGFPVFMVRVSNGNDLEAYWLTGISLKDNGSDGSLSFISNEGNGVDMDSDSVYDPDFHL